MMTTATMTIGNWFRTLKGRRRCPKDKASYRRDPLNILDIPHFNNSICKLLFGALFRLTLNTVSYSTLSDSHEKKSIRLHVLPEAVKVDRIVSKPSSGADMCWNCSLSVKSTKLGGKIVFNVLMDI